MNSVAFDNREMAALFWLAIFIIWCLCQRKIRASFVNIFRTAMYPKVVVPILVVLGYIALEVWLAYRLSLWRVALLKPTLLWVAVSAVSRFFAFDEASKNPHFIRHSVIKAIGIAAFLEFFMNIAPMHFAAEFVLLPTIAAVKTMSVIAGVKEEHRMVKRLMDTFIALIGFALLVYTARRVYHGWDHLDKQGLLLQLALPAWLSIGLVPYIYAVSLIGNYETAYRPNQLHGERPQGVMEDQTRPNRKASFPNACGEWFRMAMDRAHGCSFHLCHRLAHRFGFPQGAPLRQSFRQRKRLEYPRLSRRTRAISVPGFHAPLPPPPS